MEKRLNEFFGEIEDLYFEEFCDKNNVCIKTYFTVDDIKYSMKSDYADVHDKDFASVYRYALRESLNIAFECYLEYKDNKRKFKELRFSDNFFSTH